MNDLSILLLLLLCVIILYYFDNVLISTHRLLLEACRWINKLQSNCNQEAAVTMINIEVVTNVTHCADELCLRTAIKYMYV